MNGKAGGIASRPEKTIFLTEILGARVTLKGKKIGRLSDFVFIDGDLVAEVSHLYVGRPFGDAPLVIPWDRVVKLDREETAVEIDGIDNYVADKAKRLLLLKDDVMDKKVLDTKGKEIEVVYDIQLAIANRKLYVTGVDLSGYGLLRRIGLKRLAKWIASRGDSTQGRTVPWKYVESLPEQIGSFEGNLSLKVLKEALSEMHPVDAADVLEGMEQEQRVAVFSQMEPAHASDTLEEIDPAVQRAILGALPKEKIAQLTNDMTPGQAADVLAVMPTSQAISVMNLLREGHRDKIKSILEKHEEKILNYATSRFFKFKPDVTVAHAHEQYRKSGGDADVIMYLYVIDESEKLLGVIDIRELLRAKDEDRLGDVMVEIVATFNPSTTLREASAMFSRYGFRAIPVVDENGKLLGVVPHRDMMNLKHRFLE